MTFVCYAHGSKYIKCNDSYKVEYYRDIIWYYKANFKFNLSKLETKKEELCSHLFKYINCKGDHQADNNVCFF